MGMTLYPRGSSAWVMRLMFPPLAGGVPALIGKDDRNLPAVDLVVQFGKLFLVVLERFLVFAATKLLVKGDLL